MVHGSCSASVALPVLFLLGAVCYHSAAADLGIAQHQSEQEWRSSLHMLASVEVQNQKLSSLLGPILNYKFFLPEVQLRRGLTYIGSNYRLRRVVKDLLSGKRAVNIGAIGGSVTWGQGATQIGVTDWFSVFGRWAVQAFPQSNLTLRNGAVPGTPCSYMIMCLELSVQPDVDLIFSEFVLNDGIEDGIMKNSMTMSEERLVRRVLVMQNRPAFVFMQMTSHGMATLPMHEEHKPYHMTMEDVYSAVAQYYDTPTLSLRNAIYRLASFKNQSGYSFGELFADTHHPGDLGQRAMADLAVYLIQQTAIDLMMRPFGNADAEMLQEQLPLPIFPGNEAPKVALCLHGPNFVEIVVSAEGYNYTNEGTDKKPKFGYVATTVGSELKFKVSTQRGGKVEDTVQVMLSYLRSYEHMGTALVSCASGCTCEAKEVDAHHEHKESQLYLAILEATQHDECLISVKVIEATKSSEHKFKVSGVMMSEVTKESRYKGYSLKDGHFGATMHTNQDLQHVISKGHELRGGVEVQVPGR